MLLSLNWLREFVPYAGSAEELGERLTMLGLELEEIVHPFHEIREWCSDACSPAKTTLIPTICMFAPLI